MECYYKCLDFVHSCELETLDGGSVSISMSLLAVLRNVATPFSMPISPIVMGMSEAAVRKTISALFFTIPDKDGSQLSNMYRFGAKIGSTRLMKYSLGCLKKKFSVMGTARKSTSTATKTLLGLASRLGVMDHVHAWELSLIKTFSPQDDMESTVLMMVDHALRLYERLFTKRQFYRLGAEYHIPNCMLNTNWYRQLPNQARLNVRTNLSHYSTFLLGDSPRGISEYNITLHTEDGTDTRSVSLERLCLSSAMFRGIVRFEGSDYEELKKSLSIHIEGGDGEALKMLYNLVRNGGFQVIINEHELRKFMLTLPVVCPWFAEPYLINAMKKLTVTIPGEFESSNIAMLLLETLPSVIDQIPTSLLKVLGQSILHNQLPPVKGFVVVDSMWSAMISCVKKWNVVVGESTDTVDD